jgi:hypothetical protein
MIFTSLDRNSYRGLKVGCKGAYHDPLHGNQLTTNSLSNDSLLLSYATSCDNGITRLKLD